MSDIFFTDAGEAPVPPNEVRVLTLAAAPRRDGKRVDVHAALTPFQRRPNLEMTITNEQGDEVAALSVVEAIDPKMDFTMHLREAQTGGRYTVDLKVFYADVEAQQSTSGKASAGEILNRAKEIVDQRRVEFEIEEG